MSLTRFAIRHCAAQALKGATLADDRVFQSEIDPLDAKVSANRAPMLIVNTDDHMTEVTGRDMAGAQDRLDLVIEATIADKVTTPGEGGDGQTVSVTIPGQDAGMDLTLDIIAHQTVRAITRRGGVWGDLLARFVLRIHSTKSRRGANSSGVRFAARQIVITLDAVADPVGGESLAAGTLWGDFVAALEADPAFAPVGALIRSVLIGDGQNPEWERVAHMIGIRAEAADQIGFWPLVFDDDGQPVTADEVALIDPEDEP